MAEAPSLDEIINIARNPGQGPISPRAKLDTTEIAHMLTQAGQFKAENDWRKYSMFMENLKGMYKNLKDIQGMEVAEADRPYLQEQAAGIFKSISDNPRAFFEGKMGDIEQKVGKLRSEATQSVQDHLFDQAHRAFLDRDSTLNTPENKSKIDDFFKQPLGQRKYYTLDVGSLWNPMEEAKQINGAIAQKTSWSGLTPDGKYISTQSGTRYDSKMFKTYADEMYNTPNANGQTIQQQVAKRFSTLPTQIQDYYNKQYPNDPIKGYHDEMVNRLIAPTQVDKNELKSDPFAVELLKNKDKLQQEAVKFGYDKVLESIKLGRMEDLELFKQQLKNKGKKEQTGALNNIVDSMVNDALTAGKGLSPEEQKFWGVGASDYLKMNVSSATLEDFAKTKYMGGKAQKIAPDELEVSRDGKTVRAIFRQGDKIIDEQSFPITEFKLRFGKSVLGVSATEKEINDAADEPDVTHTTTTKKPKLY